MDRHELVALSKFLSFVLRHEPESMGLVLDAHGWVDVDVLLAACIAHGRPVTRDQLFDVVRTSDKQRFALTEDARAIRANQGHSVPVDLALPPATPPELLHHGTVARFLPAIRARGLVRGARHDVHLSATLEGARVVGQRRGTPVVLTVRAGDMARDGHTFHLSDNGVWLVDHVPAGYLTFPEG